MHDCGQNGLVASGLDDPERWFAFVAQSLANGDGLAVSDFVACQLRGDAGLSFGGEVVDDDLASREFVMCRQIDPGFVAVDASFSHARVKS